MTQPILVITTFAFSPGLQANPLFGAGRLPQRLSAVTGSADLLLERRQVGKRHRKMPGALRHSGHSRITPLRTSIGEVIETTAV